MDSETKRIHGCLFGGWCGDAAGATLEFCNMNITEEMVVKAMRMPGGGVFNVGPGQVTDDSELEIGTMNAIAKVMRENENNKTIKLPLDYIANEYIEWYRSHPYDIGNTCTRAFGNATCMNDVLKNARNLNQKSMANGAMMRAAAIGIWSRNANNDEDIMNMGRYDSCLSHINPICQEVNGLYCLIIAKLIQGYSPSVILGLVEKYTDTVEVDEWFHKASLFENINCKNDIGLVKHAFMLVIYFLRQSVDRYVSYEEAIKKVLLQGGDTDTNAKIVGNVMGALHGIDAIPAYMINPVLEFDCSKNGNIRPLKYSVKEASKLIAYL